MLLSRFRCAGVFCACAALFLGLGPARAAAQQRYSLQFESAALAAAVAPASVDQDQEMDDEGRMTTSGFFLGIVGMLAGAAVGSGVGNAKCGDDCVGRTAAGGAAIAGALMVPVGVHIAAPQPRRFPHALLTSFAAGALAWGGVNAIPGRPVALAPFIAAPLQVWIATRFESARPKK
jgi:hypothetical protein